MKQQKNSGKCSQEWPCVRVFALSINQVDEWTCSSVVAYGCTELSGPCVQSGVRNTNLPITAAGTLIANIEMKFLDLDGSRETTTGPGEITVRGPNVMM